MKPRSSLRNILTINFVLVTILPILGIGLLSLQIMTVGLEKEISERNLLLANSISGEVERFLDEPLHILKHVEDVIDTKQLITSDQRNAYLDSIIQHYQFFDTIMILDHTGIVRHLAPYSEDLFLLDMSGQDFFRATSDLRAPYWSSIFISTRSGEPTLTLSIPFKNEMIVGYLNLSALNAIIAEIKIGSQGYALITDNKGTLIAHRSESLVSQRENIGFHYAIQQGLSGQDGTFEYQVNGINLLGSVVPVSRTGWLVGVTQPVDESFSSVIRMRNIIGIGALSALVIAIIIALFSLKKTLQPLLHLTEYSQKIAHGDYRAVPLEQHYQEIDQLTESFNVMREAVNSREEALRQSEEDFRSLAENSQDYIMRYDEECRHLYENPAALQVSGLTEEDIIGKTHLEAGFDEDLSNDWEEKITHVFKTGESIQTIFDWEGSEGKVYLDWRLFPEFDLSGRVKTVLGISRDITKLAKAEEAIRLNEERLRLSTEAANVAVWEYDIVADHMEHSSNYDDLYGLEVQKVWNTGTYLDATHLDDRQASDRIIEEVFAPGGSNFYSFDYRIIWPDESVHWLMISGEVTKRDDNGNGILVRGCLIDITDRKMMEEELKKQKDMFELVINLMPIRIFWKDINSVYLGCNSSFAKAAGETETENVIGKNDFELIWGQEAEKYIEDDRQVLRSGMPKLGYEEDYTTPDGKFFWWRTNKMPLKDNEGNIFGILATAEDITERKSAEEALKKSEENFRNIFEQSPLAIQIYDKDGKLFDANEQTLTLFGIDDKSHVLGFNMWADPNMPAENAEILKNGEAVFIPTNLDFDTVKKTGLFPSKRSGIIYLDMYVCPLIGDRELIGYLVQIIEVTERVRAEKEKHQMEVHLRHRQKLESIGTLAGGVAHEINNPIMGIMNYAQLIYDRIDPTESRLREFSAGIIEESERVAEIVRNLLTFARQEKHFHSLAKMTDIVDNTLSLIQTIIKRDQIILEINIPDALPKFRCRSQQIQQVLINLITNARDALNERYPEYDPDKIINISVKLFEKEGHRWLRTTVEDSGAGIPVEIRERIFDPFYTTKDRATGTGLGLSISLGIIQDHHGNLTFESEEGKGTRFYLDLPVDNGWKLPEIENKL